MIICFLFLKLLKESLSRESHSNFFGARSDQLVPLITTPVTALLVLAKA